MWSTTIFFGSDNHLQRQLNKIGAKTRAEQAAV
jgi:hypothetical protein